MTVKLFEGNGDIKFNGGDTLQDGDYGTATGANIGSDTLVNIEGVLGSAHNDVLTGGNYFFEIFRGNGGDDIIDGGGGLDIADYRGAANGVSVDLKISGGVAKDTSGSSIGTDTLSNVEGIYGTAHQDVYYAADFKGVPTAPSTSSAAAVATTPSLAMATPASTMPTAAPASPSI